jgi:predicted CoA-substrate-specific enzyme activase
MKTGIDCGSKFIKIVIAADNYLPITTHYLEHHGAPERVLTDFTGMLTPGPVLTGSHAGLLSRLLNESRQVGEIEALLAYLAHFGLGQKYVVNVGAGSMALIGRDEEGDFKSYRENNLCAAGTGSFIDEQMHRLGFGYDDVTTLPLDPDPPVIATRCAVFAKSDLIHRQQEGHGPEGLWSGLCRGVVSTMLQSVFRGDVPEEEILFCGGLFINPAIRYWTSRAVPGARYHDDGHLLAALGCLHLARGGDRGDVVRHKVKVPATNHDGGRRLELSRSVMPDFTCRESYESGGCEVRVHDKLVECRTAALGIDIGSTSTKLVLVDVPTGGVVLDIYARTGGNPVDATRRIFREAKKITGGMIAVAACGTTGSGRKLVGAVTGADVIVNEITAHFRGARAADPAVETIFEIGGQDSKYIRGRDGMVVDCNMNFVCAAGTGSFIEEQAGRLGFKVREIGDRVLGIVSPQASDRCTVFMEQDINKLLRESRGREEALAAVVLAIAKNYLNRVVGPRPVTGEKIFFQGATARNAGLVAAFESLLDREIVVSPWCHVMGAYGAALIALEKAAGPSKFRGLRALEGEVRLEYGRCGDCSNRCTITTAVFEDGTIESWGYLCGREGVDRERARAGTNHFSFIRGMIDNAAENEAPVRHGSRGTMGIPAALSMFNYLPLWRTFLEGLGFRVVTSTVSAPGSKERAVRLSKTDFCFPVKAAFAHFEELAGNDAVDIIFFPVTISEKKRTDGMPRIFCPYVISCPAVAGALDLRATILSPVIDFRDRREVSIAELHRVFSPYGISTGEIDAAFREGEAALERYIAGRFDRGRNALEKARLRERKTVVFIGRPYNLYDTVINLNLPERFRHYGVDIMPYEMLIEPGAEPDIEHMYWNYGELILSAAEKIRGIENVFPVYLTNFSCGPDSFILSRFESIMEGKPYLIIELDEHGSETGYITRIEAFIDIILEGREAPKRAPAARRAFSPDWRGGRKLWIPPMHEVAARLFAAGFRAWGFDSEALPVEGSAAYESGKRSIRGSECLPAATTIGAFLSKMRETGADPARQALFMPTAEGPCRFGQYAVLHRGILDRQGFGETMIFSPSSVNSYMGMPPALRLYLWDIVIASDMIMKALCRVRPYELEAGAADRRAEELLAGLETHIEGKGGLIGATERAVSELFKVPREDGPRPLVGIVGEIYVRCNPFCNNDLIRVIEAAGGEAWLSPISEWVLYTSWFENHITAVTSRNPLTKLGARLKNGFMFRRERLFEEALGHLLADRFEHHVEKVLRVGEKYLPLRFEGEAILTLGRAELFLREGAAMVVNCAPFGCMPGNITASLFGGIQEKYGRPVLTLFYDGESDANRAVGVYLGNIAAGNKNVKCGAGAL